MKVHGPIQWLRRGSTKTLALSIRKRKEGSPHGLRRRHTPVRPQCGLWRGETARESNPGNKSQASTWDSLQHLAASLIHRRHYSTMHWLAGPARAKNRVIGGPVFLRVIFQCQPPVYRCSFCGPALTTRLGPNLPFERSRYLPCIFAATLPLIDDIQKMSQVVGRGSCKKRSG